VPKKTYEYELVPVNPRTRAQNIIVSSIGVVVGALLIFIAPSYLARPGDGNITFHLWGLVTAGLGVFFLVRSIRRTHESVLTARGKGEKAADDRIESAKQAKRDAAVWTFAFWAAVIAGMAYSGDPIADLFEGRIAVYPVYCAGKVHETGECAKGDERAGNVTKYIVHVDQQIVVGLTENANTPQPLFNCVVADVGNWSCSINPEKDSIHALMRRGVFSYDPPSPSWMTEVSYTSRWNYLRARFLNDK
jgi:hypothetical protein